MKDEDGQIMFDDESDRYGIVIDSGSSGSRIQIYKWTDPEHLLKTSTHSILQSPPRIVQERNWSKKISPGISTYNSKSAIKDIWPKHYSQLMKFAGDIIPAEKHQETPVFVLSTAGMRLLPKKISDGILKETCTSIQRNTNFFLPDCESFVQIIDGSTEGLYGWLGLNYLMNSLNEYQYEEPHESIGFMDMGGASTQIAFVPSSKEDIDRHADDLSKIVLRNINGDTQVWDVFVATWLGFGANEARRRFLHQLISLTLMNGESDQHNVNDPCLPKGATMSYEISGKKYLINGVGNYESCTRSIYPLLMKTTPCKEEPCLFNGIHGPRLDFEKDKFVGISEYWYTANDIFQSGGEYNFEVFNKKVKDYCESEWSTILDNSKDGAYSNLDPNKFLKDACFKASWVMNILHEGFELPRLDFEIDSTQQPIESESAMANLHVPFKSANSVEGEELSWTLGKILLYASSQIKPSDGDSDFKEIGIWPSEISGRGFIPGGVVSESYNNVKYSTNNNNLFWFPLLFLVALILALFNIKKGVLKSKKVQMPISAKKIFINFLSKVPIFNKYLNKITIYQDLEMQNSKLEEGLLNLNNGNSASPKHFPNPISVLRTRSALGISQEFSKKKFDGSSFQ